MLLETCRSVPHLHQPTHRLIAAQVHSHVCNQPPPVPLSPVPPLPSSFPPPCSPPVSYDDGDEEWLDLAKERHKLMPIKPPGAAAAATAKRRRQARVVVDSDDEEDEPDDDDEPDDSGVDSDFKGVC